MHKLIPYLKQNDLTISKLAELCSVTTQTIRNWDKGIKIKDIEKEKLLTQLVPEFEPEPRITFYETNLKPPILNQERDSDLPRIKLINKSSHDK